ncbi:MAG: Uma2 family endonuclease [Fimbriimonadales bacterium]
MAGPAEKLYTREEYLAFERASETKHEFLNGRIYAMAGAGLAHNRICTNLTRELSNQLKGKPCQVLSQDMRVKVPKTGLYTYPDLLVVCGKPALEDDEMDTLLNPSVIFEVLSPSTERYDRGEKFINFQSIESLTDYILISQDRSRVEQFTRGEGGHWIVSRTEPPASLVELPSIGCTLDIEEVYDGVEFGPTRLRDVTKEAR